MKTNNISRMSNLFVLKVGGSILTRTDKESTINASNIAQIATEISRWWTSRSGQLILVLGAGSFGHPLAHRFDLNNPTATGKSEFGFSLTISNMISLARTVIEEITRNHVPCLPMQPSAFFTLDKGRIAQANLLGIKLALSSGLVPVLWGDAVLDFSEKFRILSGDQIAAYFYESLPVNCLLFGTDVDGVYTCDPKKNVEAKKVGFLKDSELDGILTNSGPSKSYDVTGGLRGKLLEVRSIKKRPVFCQIYNATIPGNTLKALNLENVGTVVRLEKDKKRKTDAS